jgi:hypothetical protein
MAQLVRLPIERRWAAAVAALGAPVGSLVVLDRDGGLATQAAQQRAVGPQL